MALRVQIRCGSLRPTSRAAVPRPCSLLVKAHLTNVTGDSSARTLCASRRSILLAGLATLGMATLPVRQAQAAEGVVQKGMDEYSLMESAGKLNTTKALETIRAKYGFKRGPDGRVSLKGEKGTYYAVRLDMEVPGAMLFRDTSNGKVYALQTDAFQQIDLSNDQVIIMLFGDGEWESEMSPITLEDEQGKIQTLTLSEAEFRNVVGLISQAEQDGPVEAK